VSPQCDETHPLCKNCAKHFINMDRCFFDPVTEPEGSTRRNASKGYSELEIHQTNPVHGTPKGGLRPRASRIQPAYDSSHGRHKCHSKWHGPSLPITIRAGQMDPFNTHPETKTPDVDVLLSHCRPPFVFSPPAPCDLHTLGCLINFLAL
jgi:hypothetical protein